VRRQEQHQDGHPRPPARPMRGGIRPDHRRREQVTRHRDVQVYRDVHERGTRLASEKHGPATVGAGDPGREGQARPEPLVRTGDAL